jgi:hypothetical protein
VSDGRDIGDVENAYMSNLSGAKPEEKRSLGNLSIDGRIIFNRALKNQDGRLWKDSFASE